MNRRIAVLVGLCGALAGLLLIAAVASATPSEKLIFKNEITGAGFPEKSFELGSIAVNEATGNIVAYDVRHGGVLQVDPVSDEPVDFSYTGTPELREGIYTGPDNAQLAVDNSGTSSQGNIYLTTLYGAVYGWDKNGKPLGAQPFVPSFLARCATAVGPNGNLFVTDVALNGIDEFKSDGTPTGKTYTGWDAGSNCRLVFDQDGYLYIAANGVVEKHDKVSTELANLGPISAAGSTIRGLAVDPTNGNVFVDTVSKIEAYKRTDPLTVGTPFETIDGLASWGVAIDSTGEFLYSSENNRIAIFHREPPSVPEQIGGIGVTEVRSKSAYLSAKFVARGSQTSYQFELGTDNTYGTVFPAEPESVPFGNFTTNLKVADEELQPGTRYHVRLKLINAAGTSYGPDRTFTTYPTPPGGTDPCPNALERKQTGARTLFDCRAYELVSAGDTAGYDVESSLVPGQEPFAGYPAASNPPRVLYATHAGAIPGLGNPTNRGPDPYVATRGAGGWDTAYLGLPADLNDKTLPFSSVLGGADAQLDTFGFAGSKLCDPCFSNGTEVGIPVRLPDGSLIQGMAGSMPGPADAKPEGEVAKYFSDDGTHLVFGSTGQFEPDGAGGALKLYDRNLRTGVTHVVSKTPAGATMSGAGIAELDLSADGSRILIGQTLSTDANGNAYRHLYVNVDDSTQTVDLTPGAVKGALLAGMTADGSWAYLLTPDKLLPGDTDTSSDLYAAAISANTATLSLLTPGDSGSCEPIENSAGPHWNSVGAAASCDTVAISGGGGVASDSATVYFLSPEQLDGGEGTVGEANLYRAEPGGDPTYVTTLDADDPVVIDSVQAPASRETGDFQVTPDGGYSAFVSRRSLTGVSNGGFLSVFRYDASSDAFGCPSCDPTEAGEAKAFADASLAADGLSISDDGIVFFDTLAPLVLNDTGERVDVYEWAGNDPRLISSGIGSFPSRLLTVTHDGVDVHFFTHDKLSPQGSDGTQTRIYDARENGGFLVDPLPKPCQASDECHGAGTVVPPTPDIRTAAPGADQNHRKPKPCKRSQVKKHGKCVKKATRKKKRKAHGHAS